MAKKLLTVNVDEDVIEALDETAKKMRMSRSAYVNMLLAGVTMAENGSTFDALKSMYKTVAANRLDENDETEAVTAPVG